MGASRVYCSYCQEPGHQIKTCIEAGNGGVRRVVSCQLKQATIEKMLDLAALGGESKSEFIRRAVLERIGRLG